MTLRPEVRDILKSAVLPEKTDFLAPPGRTQGTTNLAIDE